MKEVLADCAYEVVGRAQHFNLNCAVNKELRKLRELLSLLFIIIYVVKNPHQQRGTIEAAKISFNWAILTIFTIFTEQVLRRQDKQSFFFFFNVFGSH